MAPLLLLALAQGEIDSTAKVEGVWVGAKGGTVFVGHSRVDWGGPERLYSAVVAKGADGVLAGNFVSGRSIWNRFAPMKSAKDTPRYDYPVPHLLPEGDATEGEARIATTKTGIRLGFHAKGGPATVETFTRAIPLASLSLAGRYVGKDGTITIEDDPGFGGEIRGSIVQAGKTMRFAGLRVLGRAGIKAFDATKGAEAGDGFVAATSVAGGKVGGLVLELGSVRRTLKRLSK